MQGPAFVSVDEALILVQHGHRVYIHEAAMAPPVLIDGLVTRLHDLENVEVVQLHTERLRRASRRRWLARRGSTRCS